MRSPCTRTRVAPFATRREKPAQQRRPGTAKNTFFFFKRKQTSGCWRLGTVGVGLLEVASVQDLLLRQRALLPPVLTLVPREPDPSCAASLPPCPKFPGGRSAPGCVACALGQDETPGGTGAASMLFPPTRCQAPQCRRDSEIPQE